MADGIYYDSSNKQLKFTVSGSNVLTLASGSGVTFANAVTASKLVISSSDSASLLYVSSKDSNSTSKIVFPVSNTASFFMECMTGSSLGDFRFGLSGSVAGGINGIQEALRCYSGGTYGVRKTSLLSNNIEYLSLDDSGSFSYGNTGSNAYIYVKMPDAKIGINTKNPTNDFEVNTNFAVYGNTFITGALSVGFNSVAAAGCALQVSGNILPTNSASFSLGTASLEWKDIWAQNPAILQSDRNLKTNISDCDLGIDFINNLNPVSYKFINGDSGRTHYGLIAQDIEKYLNNNNIDTNNFAALVKYRSKIVVEKQKIEQEVTSENNIIYNTSSYVELVDDPNVEYKYGLRYSEFISPLIKAVQELSQKLTLLENKLSSSK